MATRRLERIKTRIDEERRELKHSSSSYDVERIADLHKVFNSLNKLRDEVIRNLVHVGGNSLDDVTKLFDISSAEVYQIAHGKHASTRLVNALAARFVNLDETQYIATQKFNNAKPTTTETCYPVTLTFSEDESYTIVTDGEGYVRTLDDSVVVKYTTFEDADYQPNNRPVIMLSPVPNMAFDDMESEFDGTRYCEYNAYVNDVHLSEEAIRHTIGLLIAVDRFYRDSNRPGRFVTWVFDDVKNDLFENQPIPVPEFDREYQLDIGVNYTYK